MTATLLMCPPDYYGVEYEINPWMDARRNVDRPLALRQWTALFSVLTEKMGVEVVLMPSEPGHPDMVFTANAGLVSGQLFIASAFRYKQRQGEEEHFRRWSEARGYRVERLPEGLFFEGEGDILAVGDTLFGGYRFRSDIRSHLYVGELLGKRAISLELADPHFYHLDTCFCPLDNASALYYPAAFDDYGRRALGEHIPDLMEVEEEEALHFGCNAVVVGWQVALPAGCPKLRAALEERGYTVHEVEMSEFIKAGGAAKCLVLRLG